MVSPLYQIDAAVVKQRGKVHICLCDVENMPGGKKEYIWPLTNRHIQDCYRKTGNVLLENLRHVMESTYICNRYFLYAALKNADVQLSWIRERDGKLLAPSAYIRLICEATGVSVIPAKRDTITMHQIQETVTGQGRILAYNVRRMPESTAMEARMDYAICPMKYALGYILEKAPVFQSEFHNNYVINGLIAALFSLMKARDLSVDEIYRQTMEMFPFMRNVEKRQIYDYLEMQSSF